MNLENLTLKEILKLANELGKNADTPCGASTKDTGTAGLGMLGQPVIIRTYSAGCWFGILSEKANAEVVLKNARRMWRWKSGGESISLSGCALYGVVQKESKIVAPVDSVWLEAIEILPCTEKAAASISCAPQAKAE
jgi:hypothetical protein